MTVAFRPSQIFLVFINIFIVFAAGRFWRQQSDPQGEASEYCEKIEFNKIYSPNKEFVISGHHTICDGFGGNSAIYLYAYSGKDEESRNNLFFRYFTYENEAAPSIVWLDNVVVDVSIARVSFVSRALKQLATIKISYHIGWEERK